MKARIRRCGLVLAIGFAALLEPAVLAAIPGGSLDPNSIRKYQAPLVVPPAMPRVKKLNTRGGKTVDYYEIAVKQFEQQILPPGMPKTTVWGYGSVRMPGTVAEGGSFHAPSFTIEAKWRTPVRVKWINDLVDAEGNYLPHLLPVDPTVHWANPTGDCRHPSPTGRDCAGRDPEPYRGPVPIVVHVHGAETYEWADGFPEAWFLPAARNLPDGIYTTGSFYDTFRSSSPLGSSWQPGSAVFEYPNDQRATTLWYHDHALGITRLNVVAGPAGFYLLRGGPTTRSSTARESRPCFPVRPRLWGILPASPTTRFRSRSRTVLSTRTAPSSIHRIGLSSKGSLPNGSRFRSSRRMPSTGTERTSARAT